MATSQHHNTETSQHGNTAIYRRKWLANGLLILIGLRITSYFTLFPDSVAMTQLVKTVLRVILTGIAFMWLNQLKQQFPKYRVEYQNSTPLLLYCAYLILGIISIFWTSSVRYTMLQLSMIIEALVFAWFYIQLVAFYNKISDNHTRFSWLFGVSTMWICIAFMLGLFFDPDTYYRQTHGGEVSRLGGYIINPNELGMLAVLGAVMAYTEFRNAAFKMTQMWVLIASVAVLLLTQSRSSLGAFLIVTGIYVFMSGNRKLILGSIVGAVFALPILVRTIILKQGDVEEVMSMTGRLPFWEDLIMYGFTKEPLLGYGFMRISYSDKFDSIHSYAAGMTHNTFIQVLLNLGLVGGFICMFQMIATGFVIGSSKDSYHKVLAWLMLVPLIINSTTEFGIFGESNYGIQFYQFVVLFFVMKVINIDKKIVA